jgi:hypothetical protein
MSPEGDIEAVSLRDESLRDFPSGPFRQLSSLKKKRTRLSVAFKQRKGKESRSLRSRKNPYGERVDEKEENFSLLFRQR